MRLRSLHDCRHHAESAAGLGRAGGAAGPWVHTPLKPQIIQPVVSVLSFPAQHDSPSTSIDRSQLGVQSGVIPSASGLSSAFNTGNAQRQQQQQEQQQQQQADWGTQQNATPLIAAAAAAASAGSTARATTAILGSPPGVTWHRRRQGRGAGGVNGFTSASSINSVSTDDEPDWTVQYAAAAILGALEPNSRMQPASSTNSSSSSSGTECATSAAEATAANGTSVERQPLEAELQQQQQKELVAPDFSLVERRASHGSASSSGRDDSVHHCISSSKSVRSVMQQQQQQQLSSAGDEVVWMQQGPAANFRDPRFEQALSRWVKEAPDWIKVRTVYERFGRRFNIVNLACCFSKLADLFEPLANRRMLRKERAALKQFMQQLLQDTAALLPSVDGGTAAALLGSWARLVACGKMQHSPQLVSSLLQHLSPHLASMKPKELVGAVWALARLKQQPPEGWMDCLFASTQKTLQQLRADEVCVLIRGLAGVQAQPPPQAWLSALLAHAEAQLEIMEPQQMAMMLIGLANMQARPNRSWMDAAMAALRTKFDAMGPQALSNVMWALSLMGCLPDRSWLAAYFNTTLLLLNSFNPRELAVGMWAVSRARLEPSDEWLDEYFDQSEAKLTAFSLRDLCLCGYSLAKLGLRPPQTWLRRYCTLLLRLKSGLWHQKSLLTQALVALDSFKVPRMDMWRRELYIAAGYKLYTYPNWRQRVKVSQNPTPVPFSSRRSFGRFNRRNRSIGAGAGVLGSIRSGSRPGSDGVSKQGVGGVPVALRSGDWGVMDFGGLGSAMSSYEELGSSSGSSSNGVAAGSAAAASLDSVSSGSSSAVSSRDEAATTMGTASRRTPAQVGTGAGPAPAVHPAARPQGWSNRPAAVPPRPLKGPGLVRPAPPGPTAAAGAASTADAAPSTGASATSAAQQQQM